MPGGEVAHGGELVLGGGKAGLDRGDFAEPALFLCLAEPIEQVGVDLLKPGHLRGVGPQDRAADAGMLVYARGAEVAYAHAQSDLPQLEVVQEVAPLLGGGFAVLLAGPQRGTAGNEGPVVVMTSSG